MTCAPDGGALAGDAVRRDAVIDMLAAAVGRGAPVTLPLDGDSMSPDFPGGTRLHLGRARLSDLAVGDLLVYRAGERLVCHRLLITRRTAGSWRALMSGDARPAAVTWIEAGDVVGRVIAVDAPAFRRLDSLAARLAAWTRVTRALGALLVTRLAARLHVRMARRPAEPA